MGETKLSVLSILSRLAESSIFQHPSASEWAVTIYDRWQTARRVAHHSGELAASHWYKVCLLACSEQIFLQTRSRYLLVKNASATSFRKRAWKDFEQARGLD